MNKLNKPDFPPHLPMSEAVASIRWVLSIGNIHQVNAYPSPVDLLEEADKELADPELFSLCLSDTRRYSNVTRFLAALDKGE